jgi:hypothetical protein
MRGWRKEVERKKKGECEGRYRKMEGWRKEDEMMEKGR